MELGYGTRDGLYCVEQEEDHEDCSNHKHNILMTSGCSSSTSPMHRRTLAEAVEKEHMFDKVLTPSDVGKLNRLVIPKQQAEKHLPLDASTSDKGLLLNFEDRSGKPWPFRYSYWNSSQSYVMTKGWSRFVKEKKLDAGGMVSFARGVGESAKGRLFIDWKHRPEVHNPSRLQARVSSLVFSSSSTYPTASYSQSGSLWPGRVLVPTVATAYHDAVNAATSRSSGSRQYLGYGSLVAPPPVQLQSAVLDTTFLMPMVHSQQQAAAKRVRLFGVNLDFQESDQRPVPIQLQKELSSSSSSPSPQWKIQQ